MSFLAGCAALFHVASLMSPRIAALEYEPDYPVWRHLVFIGIGAANIWLFQRRPRWFVWAYAVLTAQVLHSHGLGAWRVWRNGGGIDWISVGISIVAPAALYLLIVDRTANDT